MSSRRADPPAPASSSASAPPPPPPLPDPTRQRLPTEVLLFVVDWCAELDDDRDRVIFGNLNHRLRNHTLAALARTHKSLQHAAERALYSTTVVSPDWGRAEHVPPRSQLYSLVHCPRLRPLVREVVVKLQSRATTTEAAQLLAVLPNVEAIFLSTSAALYVEPLELLLSQPSVRIRRWSVQSWRTVMACTARYPDALSALKRLDVRELSTDDVVDPGVCARLETLTVSARASPEAVAAFTAPFRDTLRRLDLPMWREIEPYDLSPLVKLEYLSLNPAPYLETADLETSTAAIVATLRSGASLPSLSTFEIIGTLLWKHPRDPSWSSARPAKPYQVPHCANLIVDAIPPQIVHLTLDTSALYPEHVAAFFVGPRRPPVLRSLRIGHNVGRGLSAILRNREGWYGALAETLDKAGVDVTTVNIAPVDDEDDEDEDDDDDVE
ncbi:hypothetical protein JCM3775_003795 [Rhodotorula graminis]